MIYLRFLGLCVVVALATAARATSWSAGFVYGLCGQRRQGPRQPPQGSALTPMQARLRGDLSQLGRHGQKLIDLHAARLRRAAGGVDGNRRGDLE